MQREILRFQSVQFKYTALGHKIIFVAVSECIIIVLFTINDPLFIYRGAADNVMTQFMINNRTDA